MLTGTTTRALKAQSSETVGETILGLPYILYKRKKRTANARKSHIYIDIDQDGIVFLYTDMEGNLCENLFSKRVLDPVAPRQALEKFTADVEALNPHWREFF